MRHATFSALLALALVALALPLGASAQDSEPEAWVHFDVTALWDGEPIQLRGDEFPFMKLKNGEEVGGAWNPASGDGGRTYGPNPVGTTYKFCQVEIPPNFVRPESHLLYSPFVGEENCIQQVLEEGVNNFHFLYQRKTPPDPAIGSTADSTRSWVRPGNSFRIVVGVRGFNVDSLIIKLCNRHRNLRLMDTGTSKPVFRGDAVADCPLGSASWHRGGLTMDPLDSRHIWVRMQMRERAQQMRRGARLCVRFAVEATRTIEVPGTEPVELKALEYAQACVRRA